MIILLKYYQIITQWGKEYVELLNEIQDYWNSRVEGYSEVNQKELKGMQKHAWLSVLGSHFPEKNKKDIHILDIGCGPGFFSYILAEAGYHVNAVDYSFDMIDKARENTAAFADRIEFQQMDAQALKFENEQFDVVISRNLTWNLEQPELAYAEWHRVLKPGGKMLNFDANWYNYLYDEEKRADYEKDRENVKQAQLDDHYTCTDIDRMEKIALQMPLSASSRPDWDIRVLKSIGFTGVSVYNDIWKTVWSEEEKLNYHATPMFMIEAYKRTLISAGDQKDRVKGYWGERSAGFLEQKRAELHGKTMEKWLAEIKKYIPDDRKLKILDVGCGAGFFSVMLVKEGHQVCGIDLTPEMIKCAGILAEEELTPEELGYCSFAVMDAEHPEFAEETFDVVISRNLTWTLPHADLAYEEWLRVLKKGGILVNIDADYGNEDSTDTRGLPKDHAHHMVGKQMMVENENIKQSMTISRFRRPQWDMEVLLYAGIRKISVDYSISERIYSKKDAFYNPTPMFLICAQKDEETDQQLQG